MSKRNRIIYWVATAWLTLGMLSTGIVQLLHTQEEQALFIDLGYPAYLMTLLAIWKFLGVAALLIPKLPVLKEWAYAGFFFAMSGAVFSHLAVNDPLKTLFGPVLLMILTFISWFFRPSERKVSHQILAV